MRLLNNVSAKRLALFLVGGVAAYVLARVAIALLPESPQTINRRQVTEHIKAIEPQWERFKSTNSGFDLIEFWADTRGDGLFGVRGYLTSEVQVAELLTFITNSQPPRALYTNQLEVVDADRMADFRNAFRGTNSELRGSANGNQPSRSR